MTHDFGHLLQERDSGGGSASTIGTITELDDEEQDVGGGVEMGSNMVLDDKPHSNLHELTL